MLWLIIKQWVNKNKGVKVMAMRITLFTSESLSVRGLEMFVNVDG